MNIDTVSFVIYCTRWEYEKFSQLTHRRYKNKNNNHSQCMLTLSLQRTVETQGWGEVGEGEDMGHDFFRKTKEKAGRWKEKAQQIR